MSAVTVDVAPKAPKLTGDKQADEEAQYEFNKAVSRMLTQLRERTGGATDLVSASTTTANEASATAQASQAGATIPAPGGAVVLDPANPLSYSIASDTHATINVAGHTRTGAGLPLVAGSVFAEVPRGVTYFVYYNDPANAGGAQTFLAAAQSSLATITSNPNNRTIGSIYVAAKSFVDRR